MFDKIKDYVQRKRLRKSLKRASADIFATEKTFEQIVRKNAKTSKKMDRLYNYAIFEVASYQTPSSIDERQLEVLQIHLENVKKVSGKHGFDSAIEIQKLKAEKAFLTTRKNLLIAKEELKNNEYSFISMQYKMEQANKGPLTYEQYDLIRKTDLKLRSIDDRFEGLRNERDQLES